MDMRMNMRMRDAMKCNECDLCLCIICGSSGNSSSDNDA